MMNSFKRFQFLKNNIFKKMGGKGKHNIKSHKKEGDFKLLIHCFTGSKRFAFDLLDLGAFISASGEITFKKSELKKETLLD